MKYKRGLLITVLLILMVIVSVSCKKNDEDTKETTQQQKENKKDKKHKKNRKDKKNKNEEKDKNEEEASDNSESEKPHIILEEIYYGRMEEDTFRYLYRTRNIHFKLKEEGKEFEALRKAFDEYNKMSDEKFEDIKEELEDYSKTDESGYPEATRYDEIETYIMRADEKMVSILNYEKTDHGTRTPINVRESYNFDTQTGKIIDFTDVVKDPEEFFELVDAAADRDYAELEITKPSEYAKNLNEGDYKSITWTINAEGVTVYFDTYTLGSYEEGTQIITVYFDEAKDLFEPEYISKEKDYVFPIIHDDMTLYLDVDDDGEKDMVYVNNHYQEDEETHDLYAIGSKVIRGIDGIEFEGFTSESYIVKKDGKYYMYHFMNEVDDLTALYVIDLDKLEKIEDTGLVAGLPSRVIDWEDSDEMESYTGIKETFTDVSSFIMESGFDFLSTLSGEKEWMVGDNAYPETKNPRYKIIYPNVLHTKDDVPCSEVDKLGNVKKDATIPEDSYILFMYSDGDSYVDVRVIDKEYVDELSWDDEEYKYYTIKDFSLLDYDGDCYRITIEFEDGHSGGTVDGVTIDKLFEGMRYSA